MNIFVEKCIALDIIKEGNFTLKSGQKSNWYFDFRKLIAYPNLLKKLVTFIPEEKFKNIDLVCGVAFGGLPLANLISITRNIPQIYVRDSPKEYGTCNQIEGNFVKGMNVLLIEDTITTGESVNLIKSILLDYGLHVGILCIANISGKYDSIIPFRSYGYFNLDVQLPKIYQLAFERKSNIILSVDTNELDEIWDKIKDKIVGIKYHDFYGFKEYYNDNLDDNETEHIFINDAKLADIHHINEEYIQKWKDECDYITYHPFVITKDNLVRLKKQFRDMKFIGVVEMSTKNTFMNNQFFEQISDQIEHMDGVVLQENALNYYQQKGISLPITFSPGISLTNTTDGMNQNYRDPTDGKLGEFWIIGRSILNAENPIEELEKYREIGWKHFLNF